jgi:hypothetical protein
MRPAGSWTPSINIPTLLTTIRTLIAHPNGDDGLMPEIVSFTVAKSCSCTDLRVTCYATRAYFSLPSLAAATNLLLQTRMFVDHRAQFDETARAHTLQNASAEAKASSTAASTTASDAPTNASNSNSSSSSSISSEPAKAADAAASSAAKTAAAAAESDGSDGSDESDDNSSGSSSDSDSDADDTRKTDAPAAKKARIG